MELVYSIFLLLSAWYDLRTAKIPIWLLVLFGITGALGLLTGVSCLFARDISASCDNLYRRCGRCGRRLFFYCVSLLSWLLRNYRAFSMRPFFLRDVQSGDGSMGIYSWY